MCATRFWREGAGGRGWVGVVRAEGLLVSQSHHLCVYALWAAEQQSSHSKPTVFMSASCEE